MFRAFESMLGGVKIRYPWSSIRMNRRFHSSVSGNCTLTSPTSTTRGRVSAIDGSVLSANGAGGSSFTVELMALMKLRRELVVIEDMRFMRRLLRDSFFLSSPSIEELSLKLLIDRGRLPSLCSVRPERDNRLPLESECGKFAELEWRLDFMLDIDGRCISGDGDFGDPARVAGLGSESPVSCSTTRGLRCRFNGGGLAGLTGSSILGVEGSRIMRAVTETVLAVGRGGLHFLIGASCGVQGGD